MPLPSSTKTLLLPMEEKRRGLDFDAIRLKIASPEEIISWSYAEKIKPGLGEVLLPETINYRTQKPEMGGLFCQRIFGPVKDWQCACGKYKKIRYRGIVCDRCGVEVTRSVVRRERMGYIKLAAPVTHIWYVRSVPSRIGLLLNLSVQSLEKVIYFASFIITNVKEELKKKTLNKLEEEFKDKKKFLRKEIKNKSEEFKKRLKELNSLYQETKREIDELRVGNIISELRYRELSLKYGHIFEAGIGAEAIQKLLKSLNLHALVRDLEKEEKKANPDRKKKIIQRLKLVKNLIKNKIKPEWMVLTVIPVIPPDLRPMVQLDGGRYASSDLNDLYRRVINRNNRLKKLQALHAPEVILRNEKRMLQEAVDALLDNEMRTRKTTTSSTGQKRPLKSLADILKGKEGRFRQNLLGKRVDYSGRSVIVVGPHLKLHQCGVPKIMAIELFKPFVVSELIKRGIVHNVKSANRFIESGADVVWDILEEIVKKHYVLLNRAPTLHRLSIQAFQPVLIEGKAIQIHPLVCPAFNADFDGDQMAIHLPISQEAQKEAAEIILSSKNLLKPASGEPIVTPTKDMVWGAYYLTKIYEDNKKINQFFASEDEALLAYENKIIGLQEKIKVRIKSKLIETSVGRIIFNSVLPEGIYNLDKVVDKKMLSKIVSDCLEKYGESRLVKMLDDIKEITIEYLTKSGLSWGINDLPRLPEKLEIIERAKKKIEEIRQQYEMGLLTDEERYLKNIEVWTNAKNEITKICRKKLQPGNTVLTMVESGARGSWAQLTQMFGMKGIVSSPTGRLIELPIKSNYKDGFDVLEYFISTHGARKGVSDTALRTSSAGYLTRRLVDVTQEVIVREEDCGDKEGILITKEDSEEMGETLAKRVFGRVSLDKVVDPQTKKTIIKPGEYITAEKAKILEKLDIKAIRVRSVLTCKTKRGVCAKCYGYDLGYLKPVQVGASVGIVAAQAIGEPGTQLTLRTFHAGGVAGKDITQGLPRVEELFEVRPPKYSALIAHHDGRIKIIEKGQQRKIILKYRNVKEDKYLVPKDEDWQILVKDGKHIDKSSILAKKDKQKIKAKHSGIVKIDKDIIRVSYEQEDIDEYDVTQHVLWVKDGQKVKAGDQLTDGSLDLRELYKYRGRREVEKYILKEIQYIYSSQGQKLNDKHIEIVIRQMFSRFLVIDGGETELLPGSIVPEAYFQEVNEQAKKENKKPAKGERVLLGITKASLATDSFLAAASFQETSRVLVEASITGQLDRLYSLKENVIVGRLIPAGTGFKK
ncbi:DNA-directed RNA polymerase subunit beta' [bacterium]|nr:DNA-directed RNA polymerase subunit beta' [bacterium]